MADRMDLDGHVCRAALSAQVLCMMVQHLMEDRGHLAPGAHLTIRQDDADALIHMAGEALDAARSARDEFNRMAEHGS